MAKRRPAGLLLISVYYALYGALFIVIVSLVIGYLSSKIDTKAATDALSMRYLTAFLSVANLAAIVSVASGLWGAACLLCAVGLWMFARWSWWLAVILSAVDLFWDVGGVTMLLLSTPLPTDLSEIMRPNLLLPVAHLLLVLTILLYLLRSKTRLLFLPS